MIHSKLGFSRAINPRFPRLRRKLTFALMRHFSFLSFLFLLAVSIQTGCHKDPLDTDSDAQLLFSRDTIVFDTVFTTVGSATRHFLVHNTSSKAVKISSIRMAGGSNSPFHMNVDGVSCVSTGDVLLRGGDSMYVFVDVTINPNNSNNPLLVEDSIVFETNGNVQRVLLDAVGQDAYFHYYATLNCNEVWTNDKPHVIWGYAIIPSCCQLTIQPGTRVHLHKNSVLAADSCASLRVLGSQANPVTFQGDRLESDYAEEPGQWGFIWLSGGSRDNVIDWAVIKNASAAVRCDTMGASANPTLKISNTKIRNMSYAGILGVAGTWIEGENVAVSNCAESAVIAAYGGKYKFTHCTFGDYWNISSRTSACVVLNNWYKIDDTHNSYRSIDADFYNCIIYGDQANEIDLDSNMAVGEHFNYFFSHCLLRTNVNVSNTNHFLMNIYNQDPRFHDIPNSDLHIDAGSPAIDIGDPGFIIATDLDGYNRPYNSIPDAGAYEWHP